MKTLLQFLIAACAAVALFWLGYQEGHSTAWSNGYWTGWADRAQHDALQARK